MRFSFYTLLLLFMVTSVSHAWLQNYCQVLSHSLRTYDEELKQCVCQPGYLWKYLVCSVNCSLIPGAVKKANTADGEECVCGLGYAWLGSKCLICSQLNGTIPSTIPNICNCVKNYFWTGSNCATCLEVSQSASNFNVSICNCSKGFHWNYTDRVCMEDVKCDGIPYANGSFEGIACNCVKGFIWNQDKCILNCSAIAKSTGPVTFEVCSCESGYLFNNITRTCRRDCSTPPNTANITTEDGMNCVCLPRHSWDGFRCLLNCTLVKGALEAVSAYKCACQMPLIWNPLERDCQLNCSVIRYAMNKPDNSTCQCTSNHIWDNIKNLCYYNCNNVAYSVPNAGELIDRCECQPSYQWNQEQRKCHKLNSISLTTILLLAVGLPLLIIIISSLCCLFWYMRKNKQKQQKKDKAMEEVQKSIMAQAMFNSSRMYPSPLEEAYMYNVPTFGDELAMNYAMDQMDPMQAYQLANPTVSELMPAVMGSHNSFAGQPMGNIRRNTIRRVSAFGAEPRARFSVMSGFPSPQGSPMKPRFSINAGSFAGFSPYGQPSQSVISSGFANRQPRLSISPSVGMDHSLPSMRQSGMMPRFSVDMAQMNPMLAAYTRAMPFKMDGNASVQPSRLRQNKFFQEDESSQGSSSSHVN